MDTTERGSSPDLLKIPEVAAYLRVTRQTVYNLIASGDLHTVKVGTLQRIRATDLEAYLQRTAS